MPRGVPDISIASLLAVMYVDPMYDNISHELDGNAWPIGDVNVCSPAVDRLVRIHDQLFFQPDHHVMLEDDPQWLLLDHCVSEGTGLWVHWIVIVRIGHNIDLAILSANCILAKPICAVSEPLAVLLPVRITPPAVVDRVASAT